MREYGRSKCFVKRRSMTVGNVTFTANVNLNLKFYEVSMDIAENIAEYSLSRY